MPGLMVLHSVLHDHAFMYLLGLGVGKFALVDKGGNAGIQGMDTLSMGSRQTTKRSSLQKCQKWSLDLIVVPMASSTCQDIFWHSGVIVPLSMRVWRVSQSLPLNIIFSCFHPVLWLSASSA